MVNPIKLTSKNYCFLVCVLLSFALSVWFLRSQAHVVNCTRIHKSTSSRQHINSYNGQSLTFKTSSALTLPLSMEPLSSHPHKYRTQSRRLSLNGVLHGSNINTDSNNLNSGDIYVQETKVAGSYELVATSVGASTSSFSGSGTIVTLTFNVVSAGSAGLSLSDGSFR